jgi:hypothetical protein
MCLLQPHSGSSSPRSSTQHVSFSGVDDFIISPSSAHNFDFGDLVTPRPLLNLNFEVLPVDDFKELDRQRRESTIAMANNAFAIVTSDTAIVAPGYMLVHPNLDDLQHETDDLFRQGFMMEEEYLIRTKQISLAKQTRRPVDIPHVDFTTSSTPQFVFTPIHISYLAWQLMCFYG